MLVVFQAEAGIRGVAVTGVQTCALPISRPAQQRAASWAQTADPAAVRSPGEAALGGVAMPEPRRVGPEGGAGCGTARGEEPREGTRPAPRSAASPVAAAGRGGGGGGGGGGRGEGGGGPPGGRK